MLLGAMHPPVGMISTLDLDVEDEQMDDPYIGAEPEPGPEGSEGCEACQAVRADNATLNKKVQR